MLALAAAMLLAQPCPAVRGVDEPPGDIAESESYVLRSAVFGSAGELSSSESYELIGTLGQPHPVGLHSGTLYDLYAGFWNWSGTTTDVEEIPPAFSLRQNYPNPFNPVTTIEYSIPGKSIVDLSIYDVAGRKVRTLVSDEQLPGSYSLVWDGRNDGGRQVATGVYFYRLTAGRSTNVKKMVILR
jgi:hypothetical protein